MRLVLAALVATALAGCGGSAHAPRLSFGYDTPAPLRYLDRGIVARRDGVVVHDVAFVSEGQRVDGYLAERAGARRLPGIVVVHGAGGDRRELLPQAVALAARGAVALTVTEPSTAHPPRLATGSALLAQSRDVEVRDVFAVRRAADVLGSLPAVDPHRLGYLGWSAGAKDGIFVAVSDSRFRALALLSAGADKLTAFVAAAPKSLKPLVKKVLGSVDPIRYIALARPGTILLEDGTRDEIIPRGALLNIMRAAPKGTVVRWYMAGHALNADAYRYAFAWLLRKLAS